MKQITLKKTETGRKNGKYNYRVIENGYVLCQRNSNREYVACYVTTRKEWIPSEGYYAANPNLVKNGGTEKSGANEVWIETKPAYYTDKDIFETPFFFGRMELVGKADSSHLTPDRIYALAVLDK